MNATGLKGIGGALSKTAIKVGMKLSVKRRKKILKSLIFRNSVAKLVRKSGRHF